MRPQSGIFALGTTEHCYVELDLLPGASPDGLVSALAGLTGPDSPLAGVNVVVALRPELWRALDAATTPVDAASFEAIEGHGLTMPATQHDAWLWIAGGARDAVFDATVQALGPLRVLAAVASEITGWVYRHDRDLTGFVDGTENPSPLEAPAVALDAHGASVVLVQRWRHRASFAALDVAAQERVIGRTKADSTELDDEHLPPDSHVARNVIEEDGEELAIYRRNTAYGGPTEHGTLFVGFAATRHPLQRMLESMAGIPDGVRDALTRHTEPLTGAYYVVPPAEALARHVTGL